MTRTALYWEKAGDEVRCLLCPHRCEISNGKTGRCLARRNVDGVLVAESFGQITSLAFDPIEKKPLRRFYPGSAILSVGSFGCNLSCPFCQNYEISAMRADSRALSPASLAGIAADEAANGNIGIAHTYNEPLVGYEFVLECAGRARGLGLKNVLVTNGAINQEPLLKLLPVIDAMNIDLKCFSVEGYRKLGGTLETVKNTIRASSQMCHVEVTTLIVPGISDSEDETDALSGWLASVDRDIPLHISRYSPRYNYHEPATDIAKVYRLVEIAKKHLKYVYTGNC